MHELVAYLGQAILDFLPLLIAIYCCYRAVKAALEAILK